MPGLAHQADRFDRHDLADRHMGIEELCVRRTDHDVRIRDPVEAAAGADAVDRGDHVAGQDAGLDRGPERWVKDQLEPSTDGGLETRLRAFPTLSYSIAETLTRYNADQRSLALTLQEFREQFESLIEEGGGKPAR